MQRHADRWRANPPKVLPSQTAYERTGLYFPLPFSLSILEVISFCSSESCQTLVVECERFQQTQSSKRTFLKTLNPLYTNGTISLSSCAMHQHIIEQKKGEKKHKKSFTIKSLRCLSLSHPFSPYVSLCLAFLSRSLRNPSFSNN